MSKKFPRNDQYDDYDNDHYENGYRDQLVERRKNKRIRNALRSKDIYDLMHIDEDY